MPEEFGYGDLLAAETTFQEKERTLKCRIAQLEQERADLLGALRKCIGAIKAHVGGNTPHQGLFDTAWVAADLLTKYQEGQRETL